MLIEAGLVGLGVLGGINYMKKKAAAAAVLNTPAAGNSAAIPAASTPVTTTTTPGGTTPQVMTGTATYEQMPDSPTAAQGIVNTVNLDSSNPQTASIEGSGQSQLMIVAPSGLQIGDLSTDTASAFGVVNRTTLPAGSVTLVPMVSGQTVNFTSTLSDGSTATAVVTIS